VESSNGKQTMVPTRTFEVRPDHGDGPYSFFHEEVPVGRTCHDALVPEIICECSSEVLVHGNATRIQHQNGQ
jgi:hypothetical protein